MPEISLAAALRDLHSSDVRVRMAAAESLGQFEGQEEALRALRAALRDDAGEVRYAAALSLARVRDGGAFEALCDQVEDGNPMARQAAAIALGRIGDARAGDALRRALRDGSADVRFQAVASLAEVEGLKASPAIRGALGDPDAEVRASAAAALGDVGDRDSADALARLLEDPFSDARFEAAYALSRVHDPRAGTALLEFAADREHGLAALEALTRMREERARPAAQRILGRLFAPALVKVRAAGLLRALGDPRGTRHLEKATNSRREDVRGLAREILAAAP